MEETKKFIRKIIEDSIIEKKKHYNAANRKHRFNLIFSIPVILITITSGSVFLYTIFDPISLLFKIIISVISFIAAIFTMLQFFFSFDRIAIDHKEIANKFLTLAKECNLFLSASKDALLTKDELFSFAKEKLIIYDSLINRSSKLKTNSTDYKKAKEGIEDGEENYSDKDLSIL